MNVYDKAKASEKRRAIKQQFLEYQRRLSTQQGPYDTKYKPGNASNRMNDLNTEKKPIMVSCDWTIE